MLLKRLMTNILKKLASVKITGFCILWLFVLTFWGTVAQVSQGLYAAQERYFFSFFFKVWGVIPFPGAQGVLWVMFINLCASSIVHFSKLRTWRSAGLKLTHIGILIYFVAAFATFHLTQESNLHLMEGESTNVGTSYAEWEMASWKEDAQGKQISAHDLNKLRSGDLFMLDGKKIAIVQFYLNCEAFRTNEGKQSIINSSGIDMLSAMPVNKEREKNIAGGIFMINDQKVLLYGAESNATRIGDRYYTVRLKRFPLPFTLKLKKFKAKFHPGTNVASSYESLVEMIKPNAVREVRIYMNNPLREKDYTFYQASYSTDEKGRQYSTLAVVKNAGQMLPYIACFVVFFGLALHFILAALDRKRS